MSSNRALTLAVTGSVATRFEDADRSTHARSSLRTEDLHRAAQILITMYGTGAATFAAQRARHAELSNFKAGARLWQRIARVFGTAPIGEPRLLDLWSGVRA
jgi:hypothetical protein